MENLLESQANIQEQQLDPVQLAPQNKWWKVGLLVTVALFLATAGVLGFYVLKTQKGEKPLPTPQIPTSTPTETGLPSLATPSPSPIPPFPPLTETFQEILSKNCRKIGDERSYFYGIDLKDLPVLINPLVVKIRFRDQNTIVCAGDPGDLDTNYATIDIARDDKTLYLNVYDKNSKELGHGGPPFLGVYGNVIKETEDIKLTVYLGWPHAGPGLVGDVPVVGRGQKTLGLSNGETIYVNISAVIIDGNDPRLTSFLDNYSQPSEYLPGRREISSFGTEEAATGRFFGNLLRLESPEKEGIAYIEKILGAVSAR